MLTKPSMAGGLVTVNGRKWQHRNLSSAVFRNGDAIPLISSNEEWELYGKNGLPASCWYRNDAALAERYGRLYNWFAVNDPRGLAPEGFRIPSLADWDDLITAQGGAHIAGLRLKSDTEWNFHGGGNNVSGFGALPGGGRGALGSFLDLGDYGNWWCSDTESEKQAGFVFLSFINNRVTARADGFKASGLSVRCLAI